MYVFSQDQDQDQNHSRKLRPIMATKSGTIPFKKNWTTESKTII